MVPKAFWILLILPGLITGCSQAFFTADQVKSMNVDELRGRLDDANTVVLDVRYGKTWTESNQKIRGARRAEPAAFSQWADTLDKEKDLVLY